MRISLDEFPHCKHHGLVGYEYDTVEQTFHNRFNREIGGINGSGYYTLQTHSKTELTASGDRRKVHIRRSQVVYWIENGLPEDWVYQNKVIKGGLCIDHINRDKSDDRLENLRLTDWGSNMLNRPSSDRLGDPEFRKLVAQRYDAGANVHQVARRCKTDWNFVKLCVLEFGYKIRPAATDPDFKGSHKNYGILAKHKQFIIDKRAEGWSDLKIAKVLGVTLSPMWRFRKRHGVK